MQISVFGLGYVGIVTAACLAKGGHKIIAVDVDAEKIRLINAKISPICEQGLQELLEKGDIFASSDVEYAINNSDLSFVCVGTPSGEDGNIDLAAIREVCKQIGSALAKKQEFHSIAIRSTILPGTMQNVITPILQQYSGKQAGVDFGICHNPEFMREASAVSDFFNPPKILIGEFDPKSGDILAEIYQDIQAPFIRCSPEVAEMSKYADNAWHATKITFANEIGNLCKKLGGDSQAVMDIFCKDTKLNISPAYLKPGFAFGGSCLPKDLRSLNFIAKQQGLEIPLLAAVPVSNRVQIDIAIELIKDSGKNKIGILGFAFKAGTGDCRESPVLEVIDNLLLNNFPVTIYDKNVSHDSLPDKYRAITVASIEQVVANADLIVIGNNASEFANISDILTPEQLIIDLVGCIS